ncbi:MAG: ATP-binding protein [Deltaproteobacteria bacterium]|nr:ATP-binding protein [Deltaproteobacteria bacterium]
MIDKSFRLDYGSCLGLLRERLAEPAPGLLQLLSGPRQVGKTTLLLELERELGEQAIYAAADGPEALLPGFWERLWQRAATRAKNQGRSVVLLDEVQRVADWSSRLKSEWDRIRRKRLPVHVVATGSSALQLAGGSRESLAGRFENMTLVHWSAAALVDVFGLSAEEAVEEVVRRGAYPGAVALRHDEARCTAYVRDAIVEPAIGRDLMALSRVRRPALLRQVFALAASAPSEVVSLQKLQGQLQDRGALETIASYLQLLEEAYLVAALRKVARQPTRRRASPPKLVPLSNALCAAVDPRGPPDPRMEPDRHGRWVENACIAFAWNAGQHPSYWRERSFEVDVVLDGSWGAWAIEIKTGAFRSADLLGLFEFVNREPAYQPLLLCDPSRLAAADRLGIATQSWQDFLLHGPPAGTG